jgi:hypothetical protein
MMKFSQEFIDKLIEIYPSCADYHKMAIDGDGQLLNALNCMCDEQISNEDIITCMEKGAEGQHNLYTRAKRLKEREDIYFKALEEFENNG